MFFGCTEIVPKWEICEHHDNITRDHECCWTVQSAEEQGTNNFFVVDDGVSFEDTMNNVAYVGHCVACEEQNILKQGLQNLMFPQEMGGQGGHAMCYNHSDGDTDDDQMEYTNNKTSGEESYYYSGNETKIRNECFMTEILEEKVTNINIFLKKVAIKKSMQDPEIIKFGKIGIRKVSDIMTNVF
jgi:hypothetical protein